MLRLVKPQGGLNKKQFAVGGAAYSFPSRPSRISRASQTTASLRTFADSLRSLANSKHQELTIWADNNKTNISAVANGTVISLALAGDVPLYHSYLSGPSDCCLFTHCARAAPFFLLSHTTQVAPLCQPRIFSN